MIEVVVNNIMMLLALAMTGFLSGILAGLLGVGGGIVIVPVLFFLFQAYGVSSESAITIATATSLAIIVPTSISSIRAHHAVGNVDFELLLRWAPFTFLGVLCGSWIVTEADGTWLAALFGVIATLSALNMLRRPSGSPTSRRLPGRLGQSVLGAIVGLLSSMMGIGGGTLSVPLLTLYNYPMHKSVGTAAAFGLIISLPGAVMMLVLGVTPNDAPAGTFGLINLIAFLCVVPLTVIFAPIGVALATKLNAAKLKRIFDLVLLVTGLRMLMQGFP